MQHYTINLEPFWESKSIVASCTIKLVPVDSSLDMLRLDAFMNIDSVWNASGSLNYEHQDNILVIALEKTYTMNDTVEEYQDKTGFKDKKQAAKCNLPKSLLRIYPNPAKNRCSIEVFSGIGDAKPILSVYNLAGKKVYENCSFHKWHGRSFFSLHVKNWSEGIYLIKVKMEKESLIKKLVVYR